MGQVTKCLISRIYELRYQFSITGPKFLFSSYKSYFILKTRLTYKKNNSLIHQLIELLQNGLIFHTITATSRHASLSLNWYWNLIGHLGIKLETIKSPSISSSSVSPQQSSKIYRQASFFKFTILNGRNACHDETAILYQSLYVNPRTD